MLIGGRAQPRPLFHSFKVLIIKSFWKLVEKKYKALLKPTWLHSPNTLVKSRLADQRKGQSVYWT